jgi:hypothetical protein
MMLYRNFWQGAEWRIQREVPIQSRLGPYSIMLSDVEIPKLMYCTENTLLYTDQALKVFQIWILPNSNIFSSIPIFGLQIWTQKTFFRCGQLFWTHRKTIVCLHFSSLIRFIGYFLNKFIDVKRWYKMYTVKKGHARTFSSALLLVLLLKIPKVSHILRNSSWYLILHLNPLADMLRTISWNITNFFEFSVIIYE